MTREKIKAQIFARYPYRIELHAHTTPASVCSDITPKVLVETYKKLGYDAVVVANHFVHGSKGETAKENVDILMHDYEQTKKYGDELGIKVYLGAEIRFWENSNDYLIFGITEEMLTEIYELLPYGVEKFRKNYSMPDSLFIQAHPMRNGMEVVDPALLDGMEVFNMHPHHNSRVGLASVYARENHIPIIIAGSDFHHPNKKHEGVAALLTERLPEDSFDLAKLIKDGDYLLEVGQSSIVIP